ncbi:MAG: shikimate dehydrogenase [Planctomycetota bacterium]
MISRTPGFRIDGRTRVYAVFGHPVAHTASPAMQNAAFRALGMNAIYVALDVAVADLPAAVAGVRAAGFAGVNLTIPLKEAAIPLVDRLSPEAAFCRSVNTLAIRGNRILGHSTDGTGLLCALRKDLNFSPRGKRILLLGAGGAARAAAHALARNGVRSITIANRTLERARRLAAALAGIFPGGAFPALSLADAIRAEMTDLVVNATSLGMNGKTLPVDLKTLAGHPAVYDMIYRPSETPLLKTARTLGLPAVNGLEMLLHQGAAAFTIWTGRKAPIAIMRNALKDTLIQTNG